MRIWKNEQWLRDKERRQPSSKMKTFNTTNFRSSHWRPHEFSSCCFFLEKFRFTVLEISWNLEGCKFSKFGELHNIEHIWCHSFLITLVDLQKCAHEVTIAISNRRHRYQRRPLGNNENRENTTRMRIFPQTVTRRIFCVEHDCLSRRDHLNATGRGDIAGVTGGILVYLGLSFCILFL